MNKYIIYRDLQGHLGIEDIPNGYSFDEVAKALEDTGVIIERQNFVVGQSKEDVASKFEKAQKLRAESVPLSAKANELAQNPEMQPDQVSGIGDALATGISRAIFPIASSIAERGGSEQEISRSASIEAPLTIANLNPVSVGFKKAIPQALMYGAGTAGAREAGGQDATALETGIAGSIPLAGGFVNYLSKSIGKGAENVAPQILHSTVVPKSGVMKGANPPDFRVALEERMVPKGLTVASEISGLEKNVEEKVSKLAKERSEIPAWKDSKVNMINGVFLNAGTNADLLARDFSEANRIKRAIKSLREEYTAKWKKGWTSVEDAMNERSKLNSSSKVFSTDDANLSAEKKAKAIIASEIGAYVKNIAPEVTEATSKMAPYMALKKPVQNAESLTRGKTVIPLGMTQAIMSGALAGGPAGALAGLGVHQLAKTPYGAQRVFDIGQALQQDSPMIRAALTASAEKANQTARNKLYGK